MVHRLSTLREPSGIVVTVGNCCEANSTDEQRRMRFAGNDDGPVAVG
jgi:hypothetical protein